jgi:hypothetical protein
MCSSSGAKCLPAGAASRTNGELCDGRLRAEINHHHGGEDSHITIERQCERLLKYQGPQPQERF